MSCRLSLWIGVALGLSFVGTSAQQLPTVPLSAGIVIERSVRVRPGTYRLASASLDQPAVIIRGDNIVVDLTGVILEGGNPFADPDTFTGVGVLVDGARRATVRGATIRGYRVGLRARHAPRVHLTRLDLSYNWKPRLKSGLEQEDPSDWLSFHQNEKDEWQRYGAAIYLTDSDDAEIDHNRAVQGMNGLMVARSARLRIWNNTFSFLSGIGIGLYRTTDSQVMHNRLDWCVRGYSHGFYNRGQDSAALLMYEQSSRNVVAFNSMTHGGDGVFLWAGQSTMDTGRGGANDNVFYDNDVSHAVANGIEATFSRNIFVGNRIDDSWHGIWGGYSFDSLIAGNTFRGNTDGIAIEHGQNITIANNSFAGDHTAIRLWANLTQDPSWGYPKTRDTSSRDYLIRDNTFDRVQSAVDVTRTAGVRLQRNSYRGVTTPVRQDTGPTLADEPSGVAAPLTFTPPQPMPDGANAKLPDGARRGRATIVVDDWGPYDYLSPKLWPAGRLSDRPLTLRVLGPAGRWRLASIRGATSSVTSGPVPGEIALTPSEPAVDLAVALEYVGERVTTPRGAVVPAGQPSTFEYTVFDPAMTWTVNFWRFDAATDPLAQPSAFAALLQTTPIRTERLTRLAYANARAFGDGFTTRIGVAGAGTVMLPAGRYELVVTSDDGIRVWLDDRLVLEDWSIHAPKEDRIPLTGGAHRIRLEYFQNTGAAALQVRIVRR